MTIKRILSTCGVVLVAAGSAAGMFAAGAGTAVAPEPARLYGPLSGTNSWAYAIYVGTQTRTYGFQLSRSWTTNWIYRSYVGAPCADYPAPAGTILPGVVIVSGSYSRCKLP